MLSKSEAKYIQSLKDKKSRTDHGRFIAEGPKIVNDLLNDHAEEIECIYATSKWLQENNNASTRVPVKTVEDFELEKISFLQTPQQVLAAVKIPGRIFEPFAVNEWSLLLDGIQDPGNMGSILRIADWFGIHSIYCTTDTADIYNPKVVQAAMGSLLRVKVFYGDAESWLSGTRNPVYPALLSGQNIFTLPKTEPGIIIIGNEGKGIRPSLLNQDYKAITIPRVGHAESLNAAVATAIILGTLVNK